MKVSAFLRKTAKKNDTDTQATIYFRLRDKNKDFKSASELTINPNHWSPEKQGYKDRVALIGDDMKMKLRNDIQSIISLITQNYTEDADAEWLSEIIDRYHHPDKYKTQEEVEAETKLTFEQLMDDFLLKHKLSEVRQKNFRVVKRALLRYELYVRATRRGQKSFVLDIDNVTPDTLQDIWNFFENEHKYYELYPAIYEQIPEKRIPKPRGRNTLIDCFCRIRTFFLWCYEKKKTANRPFDNFRIEECTYGTPVYITLEERDKLYEKDLSAHKQVEIQRDIFVFQSLIGCRVGDLYRMTKQNVINGAIEYIPRKTKEGNPVTVRVPLNDKAKAILEKYKDHEGSKLLPFISEQKYNDAIKKAFELAEVNRIVTILDPLTNEEVKKPLYEVASSHMARRTFIGNIYKKVKDPNLIGALSGHKEGSKAFSRYREIDEEMKKELVNLLD
ncbi:integrase [Parabacteroides sp. PF5-5]|uniref:site-specific integrase n=1 Tax=Bacteroidales TaxID=171549 RepID=UPI0013D07F0B|nr:MULTISPECIES: site-specific integrase [Bacteroidales]MDH6306416.1 integrase [Parabacteroides sp. PH5-39]MDH6317432.1 integrase [Parabacteroides sp. PF5-13]MDH6321127.1 integrase [Parabacteroides sp. PH5-13]MDH6324859.1 integrase [Parabacteroides sp. PH5-8]MDH6328617.1 integrase [Parabacteroides sp. PH5-41]